MACFILKGLFLQQYEIDSSSPKLKSEREVPEKKAIGLSNKEV
jgi:hypothetical protein